MDGSGKSEFKEFATYNYENVVIRQLDNACTNLRKAMNILNSDLIINGSGYRAEAIEEINSEIYNWNMDVKNVILPAIRRM